MSSLRKFKTPLPPVVRHLPVKTINEANLNKFTGHFVGATIEVHNSEQIQELQTCGCFGDLPFRHRQKESHYLMRGELLKKITSKETHDNDVKVKRIELIQHGDEDVILQQEEAGSSREDAVVEDTPERPVLTLIPEEAFFLHFTLKCLTIRDSKLQPLTTTELFNKLIELNPQFLTRFVAYHYLRSKNWVVRSGIKFGSDFRK